MFPLLPLGYFQWSTIAALPSPRLSITDLLKKRGHQINRGNIGNATGIKIISDHKGKIVSFDVGIDKRGEGRAAIVDHWK